LIINGVYVYIGHENSVEKMYKIYPHSI